MVGADYLINWLSYSLLVRLLINVVLVHAGKYHLLINCYSCRCVLRITDWNLTWIVGRLRAKSRVRFSP